MANGKKKKKNSKAAQAEVQRREADSRDRKSKFLTTIFTLVVGIGVTVAFMSWPISLEFTTLAFEDVPLAPIVDTTFSAGSRKVTDTVGFGTTPLKGGETAAFCEIGGKMFQLGIIETTDTCYFQQATVNDGDGEYFVYTAALGYSGETQLIYIGEDNTPISLLRISGVAYTLDLDGDGWDETVIETGLVKSCYVYEWEPESARAKYASINVGLQKEAVFYNQSNQSFSPTFGGVGFLLDSYTYEKERLQRHVRLDTRE